MLAVIMSLVLLIRRVASPRVAVLGQIDETSHYSDIERHPDNLPVPGVLIMRIEASVLYFNAEYIFQEIIDKLATSPGQPKLLILDLSPAVVVDVAGSGMLAKLADQLKERGVQLNIVEALSGVREILRKQGLEEKIGHISRRVSIQEIVDGFRQKSSG
jgi:MFS superfamily sulfate permease-like transporter